MRTLVDIPDAQVRALDALARKEERSRAALIRDAIDALLAKHLSTPTHDAFGLWGKVDGVEYQERLRREW